MLRLQPAGISLKSPTNLPSNISAAMAASSDADCAAAILLGVFVQSVYDSINPNDGQFLHLPLYGKSSLFSQAHVNPPTDGAVQNTAGNYKGGDGTAVNLSATTPPYCITRYIYCTVTKSGMFFPTETVWIGYVAESTKEESQRLGRHDIVVALRGTGSSHEGIKDMSCTMSDFPFVPVQPSDSDRTKVHSGFLSLYTSTNSTNSSSGFGKVSMRKQIRQEVCRLLQTSESNDTLPVRITATGHSLGGALAMLLAADLGYNIKELVAKTANVTVCAVTFGAPKVGNDQFKTLVEKHTGFIWRYRNVGDPVPWLPPSVPFLLPYEHAGTELILDWTLSPYVSISVKSWNIFSLEGHNLELHMHVLADKGSAAVYTSMEGRLPDFSSDLGGRSVITYICNMDVWENADDCELLQQELEDVRQQLKDDQEALQLYLREVAYIGIRRQSDQMMITAPAPMVAGKSTLPQVPGRASAAADSCHLLESSFSKRDYSLLNKSADILKKEYSVPPNWLVHPNKDMVLVGTEWRPRADRPSDKPTPDNPEYN